MPYARPKLSKLRDVDSANRANDAMIAWNEEEARHVYREVTLESLGAAASGHGHTPEDVVGLADALNAKASASDLTAHASNTSNPHGVTKSQVGLSNVSNDAQLKVASNLADLSNVATARTNLGIPPINTMPTANALPQADGSGKLSPEWIDMLNGITLGTSTAGKAVTADATGNVGLGAAPDPLFRLTATSIKSTGNIQSSSASLTGGLCVGDPASPIAGGLLFARAGSAEPFIRFSCNGGGTGIAQMRGRLNGGLKITDFDGVRNLLEVNNAGDVIAYGRFLNIQTKYTPSSSSEAGFVGNICRDDNYLYVCVATNTWKRVALSSW